MKKLVVSFLGFSLVTFMIFGLGSPRSTSRAAPSVTYSAPPPLKNVPFTGMNYMERAYNPNSLN